MLIRVAVVIACLALPGTGNFLESEAWGQDQVPKTISFNRDVRPILSDKCFSCHGPDESARESDLRFDIKESAFQDLGDYHAIAPGDSQASEMIVRIIEDDEDMRMPPLESGKSLTAKEILVLRRWIDEGATWPAFWAYEAPTKHPLPTGGHPRLDEAERFREGNWIDQMVVDRLQKEGLTISQRADKTTLIRRVYFDLIGLPPSRESVESFLADDSPDAFNNIVDKLLASEHFGERMAIYWLDLVRFADTVGYHGDQDHKIAPYRDWVINSFNSNMPFDQFTREQLAGDLLPNATLQQQVASGYNRLLQTSHEGGIQPKEYTAIYAADRVRNVSGVWMGATLGCAQCHDHKYDPYTAKDFYSMASFFADVDDEGHFKKGTNALPTARPPEVLVLSPQDQADLKNVNDRIKSLQRKLELLAAIAKQKEKSDSQATENEASTKKQIEEHNQILAVLEAEKKSIRNRGSWTMVTKALQKPRTVRVLPRGDWMDDTGPEVEPAVPEFLGKLETSGRASRLDLANWLVDSEQIGGKLTARVFANRIWYLLMGVGISRSLDDFGGQGEPPSFPELLDNLAIEFIENGWDLKKLVRQIVTSQTYQQSSLTTPALQERDPYNQLFARQSRFRLPAETIRDNALAISGLLNISTIGGPSFKPYQPAGYYRHLNFPKRTYKYDNNARQYRRGVYVHWQRQFLHPTLKSLDAPSREECTAQRPHSNTPLAALALLNDPSFVESAKGFAVRILKESGNHSSFGERLDNAYWIAVSRPPSPEESQLLKTLFDESLAEFEQNVEGATKLIGIGDSKPDSEMAAPELAAWTTLARVILNLNETITRN